MSEERAEKNEKEGGIKAVIAVCAVIIVVLLIVIIVLLTRRESDDVQEETTRRNVVVTKENAEEVAEEMINQEYVAPGYYNAQMTTTWHFQTGDGVSEDAYVANDAGNTNDVYFDVFLAEDESTPILESPVIPRGGELENIALDTLLEAGTYDCVLIYHLVDENQNSLSTLRIGITIIVEQ